MKEKTLSDLQRIREIIRILIEPYNGLDHLTIEHKLWYTIQPHNFTIYRRKINIPIKVFGMWWMDDEQVCQYLWQGHNGVVIKSGQDPDRVLTSRSFIPKGWCYIRENANGTYDLEAMSMTSKYDTETKTKKSMAEWMTCTIQKDTYESLDKSFGPIQDDEHMCKHTFQGMVG